MDYSQYDILGLPYSSTKEDIEARYKELRSKYQQDRYKIGQEGEDAAEKLQKLEIAYRDIMEQFHHEQRTFNEDKPFENVKMALQNNDLDLAQKYLDESTSRSGEWHYMQSVVFYKRNWFLESKKQLEFAINLEPNSIKFRDSLDKLNKILASNTISPEQLRSQTTTSAGGPQIGAGNGTCTGSSCGDCLMCNMCCNCLQCMGGC